MYSSCSLGEEKVFTSEKRGSDETGDGSEGKPFKSVLGALKHAKKEPWPQIQVDAKDKEGLATGGYELVAKSQFKKVMKLFLRDQQKGASLAVKEKAEKEEAEQRAKNLEEAKKLVISEDKSLTPALRIKIRDGHCNKEKRVQIFGWVHRLRRQGEWLKNRRKSSL